MYVTMQPHQEYQRMQTCLPHSCLASDMKSIERLNPIKPQQTSALELFVYHCVLYMYLWNVNYTTCAPTASGVQWFTRICYLASTELCRQALQYLASRELMQASLVHTVCCKAEVRAWCLICDVAT